MFTNNLFAPQRQKSKTISTTEELAKYLEQFGHGTVSGVNVSPDIAMRQATVYACVKIISENIARLPLKLYNVGKKGVLVENDTHPINYFLKQPNNWQTPFEFTQLSVTSEELRGDSFGYKVKDGAGIVKEVIPLPWDSCTPEQQDDYSIKYKVTLKGGGSETYPQDRILHVRNLSTDGVRGVSTIAHHRETIGLALQTERHGAAIFKNGASIGRIFEIPTQLSDPAYARLKADLDNYTGAEKAGKSLILEEGLTAKSVAMNNDDAQYLETRQFQKQEIASIFQVPMFLLQTTEKNTTWGSGLEQITKGFAKFSLGPRLRRREQALLRDIMPEKDLRSGKYAFRYDIQALTEGDLITIAEYINKLVSATVINPNEARAIINMEPREGGDEYSNPNTTQGDGQDNEQDQSTGDEQDES